MYFKKVYIKIGNEYLTVLLYIYDYEGIKREFLNGKYEALEIST